MDNKYGSVVIHNKNYDERKSFLRTVFTIRYISVSDDESARELRTRNGLSKQISLRL